jgi:gliding motility-associated-like protein
MVKKGITFLFLLIISCFNASASHLLGGEIGWECLSNGQFKFHMKLYRDCNGIPGPAVVSLAVHNHPSVTTIPLNLISQSDISPVCNPMGPAISCGAAQSQPNWPNSTTPIAGATEEFIYESAPITLTGVPPASGWIFTYQSCCRNLSTTNLNTTAPNDGFTLRAIMYSYNGQSTDPCFDSSPKFLESPKNIICTGYPFTYNHNAIDPELDDLVYSWAEPLDDFSGPFNPPVSPTPIPFTSGYSMNSPLPGPAANPGNVPAYLNPNTGEISYTSYTTGNFITVVKISAYKCGQLVAEVFREIPVLLLSCGSNTPPTVTPPFQNPTTGQYTLYADTVYAGTLVTFNLAATDPQTLPNGSPQTLQMDATGIQFGTGFSSTTGGCLNPPCATLAPAPPVISPGSVSTTFSWQTDCNHIATPSGCNVVSNTYNFVIKTQDDFCPAPAINIATISITVLALPVISSPELRCIAIAPNGDATLTWLQPPDPAGTFNSYHIYASGNIAGPYTHIDSVFNYNQLSYTHVGANANAAPVYYYVQSRSGCNGMVYTTPADTLASIHLNVTNPGNGTALLTWNAMHVPNLASASGWYRIYREFPAGIWTLLDSTQSLSYIDTISICSAQINYRIEMDDASGCTSVSSIDGGAFQDLISPAIPQLDSVSVNITTGLAGLGWNSSTSTDAVGYVIYMLNASGNWVAIDTVYGYSSTTYNNLLSNASANPETYCIAAFDSCGNISPLGTQQHSMHLTADLELCSAQNQLKWNSYINIPGGLGGYNIMVSSNGGPYSLLATTSDTTYMHTNLAALVNYCYYIQAFNTAGMITASSNEACEFSNIPQPPLFAYLRSVSVTAPNTVTVRFYVDVAAATEHYKIVRSEDDPSGPFIDIGTTPYTGNTVVTYIDNTAKTSQHSYYYKVIAIDTCGHESGSYTNYGRTILLTARANANFSNTLTWNDYEDWLGTVSSYNIYRGIDGNFTGMPIANIPFTGGNNVFVDDVYTELQGEGVFSYYVEALEGPGNPYAFSDTSLSNVTSALQDALVFIPNAFIPSGSNNLFKPVSTYISSSDYTFLIFNRWGEKIFEVHDPSFGWDGNYKGDRVPGGVYVYWIKYKSSEGEYVERKGTVTLIR